MSGDSREVHVVLPGGVRDESRPSGGNWYDARVCRELSAAGWQVTEHLAPGSWPVPSRGDRERLATLLAGVPAGGPVLVDGLVASCAPEELGGQGGRLRLVALVHMPLGHVGNDGLPSAGSVFEAERRALHACRTVVTTSEWTRRWLLERYGLPPAGVRVASPGVDPAETSAADPAGRRLLCVGAVSRLKGYDVLTEALALVADLPWRMVCAGSTDVDPECAALVGARAGSGPLAGRVEVVGALTRAALAAAYAASDLVVSASRAESYGMGLAEGLARGIPVVATDVGGVPEALGRTTHGVPAMLVVPDDPVALATALRTWLSDDGTRTRLRSAAAERRTTLAPWAETARALAAALAPHAGEAAA